MRAPRVLVLLVGLAIIFITAILPLAAAPWNGRSTGDATPPILTAWVINTTGQTNPHWPGVPVNVQSVSQTSINGVPYAQVQTNRIADYRTTMTQQLIQELNGRPRASTDFRLGHTTATVGQVVEFGDDIGYTLQSCSLGYFPPGPGCPTAQSRTFAFPIQPIQASQAISTGLGSMGRWVDGSGVFNWSDGHSYNNGNVWSFNAPVMEVYDMDVCPGHAANGDYHHHSYSDCIAQIVGDNGAAHSPVHGFASDGFPIYGPWVAPGMLAESGWRTRNYDDPNSPTGCGVARVRNCLLRNPLDYTQGTVTAPQVGPRTDQTVTSLSGNVITATSGMFLQDYWYDSSCSTCLDEHNGHYDSDLGYHYHVTVQLNPAGGRLIPVFPYVLGPTFAGQTSPAVTYTPTSTPTQQPPSPTPTQLATSTPTPDALLVGHATWQGRPAQPNSAQQLPITLTLKLGATEVDYPSQTTDASGFFTVAVGTLPAGTYVWRAKGPQFLANTGSVSLQGAPATQAEMGLMRTGDANNDNVVGGADFIILRGTIGKSCGVSGFDGRADFNGDCVVNGVDFNLLKNNFGQAGVPPIGPERVGAGFRRGP